MDRNDYYGGESTSLNLIQVSFLLCYLKFVEVTFEVCNFLLLLYFLVLFIDCFYHYYYFLIYSFGRGSEEMTSLRHIWAQVGIIMLT